MKSIWKKTACAGLLAAAALLSGCGSEDKVAVVDYQQLMVKSETIKGMRQMQSIVESQCAAIAREKNVGIVMQKMAVPAGAVDITDEVLARIDGGASGDAKK